MSNQHPRIPKVEHSTLNLGFIRACVVSQSHEQRHRIRDALGAAGFDVEMFSQASEAIKAIRVQPPSLLVVVDDLTSPPDTLALLKWLHKQEFSDLVHTLLPCDLNDSERVRALLENGACDLMPLDFTEDELAERLIIAEFRSAYLRDRLAESRMLRVEASRYRTIVQHWPQAAILAPNLSRPIREVNSRALEILGMTEEEVVGKYLSLILPELFERDDFVPYADFSKNPARIQNVLYEGIKGNAFLEVRIVGMEWGNDGAVLLTFENIGRLQAIERHQSRLSQVESLRRFASEMAHEFNNILTVVYGNLLMLNDLEDSSEQAAALLQSSQRACERATELVKRLTKQRDTSEPQLRFLDADNTVGSALKMAGLQGDTGVAIVRSEDLWALRADPALVEDLLVGLIKNASEAEPGGKIEVDIENVLLGEDSHLPLEPGRYLRIAVADSGPGWTKEERNRAFEPFFTTKPRAEGMGLTRALEIAREHAGTLEIEEPPTGKGACLALYLPAAPAERTRQIFQAADGSPALAEAPLASAAEAVEDEAFAEDSEKPLAINGNHLRVLFMDDEPDIRNIVHYILESKGFSVTCARNGEEAIEAYREAAATGEPYDLLLLDLEVRGGLGGKETLAELRHEYPNIKAIVTTGYLDDIVLANHREFGFSGVLTKPFQINDLLSVLHLLGSPDSATE